MRTKRIVSLIMVMLMIVSMIIITVSARQSELIQDQDAEVYTDASGNICVWFRARSKEQMDILGASLIRLQMENDDGSWSTVYSWPESSQTRGESISIFSNTLTYYNAVEGENYRAVVKFYAELDNVSESFNYTTNEVTP